MRLTPKRDLHDTWVKILITLAVVFILGAIGYGVIYGDDIYTYERCSSKSRVIKGVPKDPDEPTYYCFEEDNSGYRYDSWDGEYNYEYDVERWNCGPKPLACKQIQR